MSAKTFVTTTPFITFHNFGDTEAVTGDVSTITDGDTFDAKTICGFGVVHNAIFNPTTAVVVVPSISGTTITFKVASGTPSGRLTVIGR